MRNSYNITILGQELSVISDSGDDKVAEIVQFVNKKMEEILRSGNGLKTLNVAILAALNISEELLQLKEINKTLCEQLESRAEKLIQMIEEAS
ncbi:MAG TPA: cell division protein ZapA [Smithella sp.]|nr:cell division protein ZapA [Smithella sp.]HRS98328.1 cell division protein ZapA [Smithella sp.]